MKCFSAHPRRAMTLLEVLAALVILSAFVAALGAWTSASARSVAATRAAAIDRLPVHRALAALRADLEESSGVIEFDDEANTVALVTNHAAGGGTPAWKRVLWRYDAWASALLRSDRPMHESGEPRERTVLEGVAGFRVERLGRGAATTAERPTPDAQPERWGLHIDASDGSTAYLVWEVRP